MTAREGTARRSVLDEKPSTTAREQRQQPDDVVGIDLVVLPLLRNVGA